MAYFFPLMNKGFSKYSVLCTENLNYITHVQRTIELLICTEGKLYVKIADEQFLVKEGGTCLIMDNTPHSYFTPKEFKSKVITITLYEPDLKTAYKINGDDLKEYQKSIFCEDDNIKNNVLLIASNIANNAKSDRDYLLVYGLSLALLSLISNSQKKIYICSSKENITINYVLQYMIDNIFKEQTLEKVSSDLGISKFYLSRIFSNDICINYKKYINALRLSAAKRLLVQTNNSINDIVKECAFESVRTFNREFTRYFNLTPTEFRKQNKKLDTVDVNSPYELCLAQFNNIEDK